LSTTVTVPPAIGGTEAGGGVGLEADDGRGRGDADDDGGTDDGVDGERTGAALVDEVVSTLLAGGRLPEPAVVAEHPATTITASTAIGPRVVTAASLAYHPSRLGWANQTTRSEPDVSGRGGPQFGGGPNMQQLMKQAQKMQEQLQAAQQELAAAEVTGSAGGGLVTATVTGAGELTALTIDPKAVDPDDVETLQDLVVAAVRDARREAEQLAEQKMGPLTGGLGGLGLPGF
jgi:DNA-binding YbaB/EbfC family protein